jgi:hypothetical protein
MGFNPRLAPYSITGSIRRQFTSKDAAAAMNLDIFRFPFAGEIVNAYANALLIGAAGVADAIPAATTNTGIGDISIWKATDADTTATYASGIRAVKRTGAANSVASAGIAWLLSTTTASPGLYALTNQSATRRKFASGDRAILRVAPRGATDAHRTYDVRYQMNYVIGHED